MGIYKSSLAIIVRCLNAVILSDGLGGVMITDGGVRGGSGHNRELEAMPKRRIRYLSHGTPMSNDNRV